METSQSKFLSEVAFCFLSTTDVGGKKERERVYVCVGWCVCYVVVVCVGLLWVWAGSLSIAWFTDECESFE